jgi:uncharacterized membrane protein YgcG
MAMAIAVSFTTSAPAQAQASYPTVTCEACRNPWSHPRDFRNFAYNQVFSAQGWMTYEQGDFFRVVNRDGQSMLVDMNMDLSVFNFYLGIPIRLPYPISIQVQIILIYDNGDQIMTMINPRAHPNGLPVGGRRARRGGSGGGGSGGGGSGGDYWSPQTGGGSNRRCGITRVDGGPGRRTCL